MNVDTTDGRVTIHGKVKTAQEKTKAETAVRQVEGVKDVKNLLQVVPAADKDVVNAADESIEDSVEAVLGAGPERQAEGHRARARLPRSQAGGSRDQDGRPVAGLAPPGLPSRASWS